MKIYFLHLPPNLERCLRGRKEQFAKLSYRLNGTEGSNPSLSAKIRNSAKKQTDKDRSLIFPTVSPPNSVRLSSRRSLLGLFLFSFSEMDNMRVVL